MSKHTEPTQLDVRIVGALLHSSDPKHPAQAVKYIIAALRAESGNVARASKRLGISRARVDRWFRESRENRLSDGGALAKAYDDLRERFPREYPGAAVRWGSRNA